MSAEHLRPDPSQEAPWWESALGWLSVVGFFAGLFWLRDSAWGWLLFAPACIIGLYAVWHSERRQGRPLREWIKSRRQESADQ